MSEPAAPAARRWRRGPGRALASRLRERPLTWALIYVAATVLQLSPFLASRPPELELGRPAPQDVVVDRDLAIADDAETELRRERARAEVPTVVRRDAEVEARSLERLDRLWRTPARGLDPAIQEFEPNPEEAAALARLHRHDPLGSVLREALIAVFRQGVLGERPGPSGIVIRPVEAAVLEPLVAGRDLHDAIDERLAADDIDWTRSERRRVAAWLTRLVVPNLVVENEATSALRDEAATRVGTVIVRIPRGRVLVRAGEPVTPSVLRVVDESTRAGQQQRTIRLFGGFALAALLAALSWPLIRRAVGSHRRSVQAYSVGLLAATIGLTLTDGLARAVGRLGPNVLPESVLPALPHSAGAFLAGLVAGVPAAAIASILGAATTGILLGSTFRWFLFTLVCGLAATFAFERPKSRGAIARSGLLVGLMSAIAWGALTALEPSASMDSLASGLLAAFLSGPISMACAAVAAPVCEWLFGVATDLRLLELSNQNLPLLRRLALEAPGTYQHSLLVGNLAESAAEAIDANPLLARVAAYYHDIGKTEMPNYFIENIRGAENPHDRLAPSMSALVIANHVAAGAATAERVRLPGIIVDCIRQHHGTKPIRYFYQKAVALAGEGETVDEAQFRYAGPRPETREAAILLLADAVEAASRTLSEPTPNKLAAVVDRILDDAVADNQLDKSPLTFEDLDRIRESFLRSLLAVYHQRIDYPGFDFERFAERSRSRAADRHARDVDQAVDSEAG